MSDDDPEHSSGVYPCSKKSYIEMAGVLEDISRDIIQALSSGQPPEEAYINERIDNLGRIHARLVTELSVGEEPEHGRGHALNRLTDMLCLSANIFRNMRGAPDYEKRPWRDEYNARVGDFLCYLANDLAGGRKLFIR